MKYESKDWIVFRDEKLSGWLHGNLSAVDFVKSIGFIAEIWDDLIDRDNHVTRDDINKAFWTALIILPCNEFFATNSTFFTPLMIGWITAWFDSNELERGSKNDRAYALTLRDMYIQIVPMCALLIGGLDHSRKVSLEAWNFFTKHESAEDWINNNNEKE